MHQGRFGFLRQFWYLMVFLTIGFAVVINVARLSTPYLNRHYGSLQFFLENQLQLPVKTDRILFTWQGSLLVANLNQIEIHDKDNENLIALADSMQFFIHPLKSLLAGKIYFKEVVVHGLHASIQQNEVGNYELKGFTTQPAVMSDSGWKEQVQALWARWPIESMKFVRANLHVISNAGASWPLSDVGIHLRKDSNTVALSALATLFNQEEPSHIAIKAKLDLQDPSESILMHTSIYHLPFSSVPCPIEMRPFFEKIDGHASLQTWIKFEKNSLKEVSTQFYLDQVAAKQEVSVQASHQVSGLLQYQMIAPQQWKVSVNNIKLDHHEDFGFQIEKRSEKSEFFFKVKNLALEPWWLVLNQYDSLKTELPPQLRDWSFSGNLLYAEGKIIPEPALQDWHYEASAALTQINFSQLADLPGVSNLNILMHLDEMGGFAQIQSDKSLFTYPNLSNRELLVTDLNLPISWFLAEDRWLIQSNSLTARLDTQPLMAYLSISLPNTGNIEPEIAWYGSQIATHRMQYGFPTTALDDPKSLEWIESATIEGVFSEVNGFYRGRGTDFPFLAHQGRFELAAKAHNLYFDYDTDWPPITQGDLLITLENQKANFDLSQGMIANSPIQQAKANILDIENPILQINGTVNSNFDNVFSVLKNSKILSEEEVLDIHLKGNLILDLGLTIPIGNSDPVLVTGGAITEGATYSLDKIDLVIDNITGKTEFDNDHLSATHLQGKVLGQSVYADLDLVYPEGSYSFKLNGKGIWLSQDIFDWLEYHPGNWIQGQSPYTFVWQQQSGKDKQTIQQFSFKTPLSDIELTGPIPFEKKKGEAFPLTGTITWGAEQTVFLELNGPQLNGIFKWIESKEHLDLLGGQLILGSEKIAQYPKTDQLEVVAQLPSADCMTWYNFGQQLGIGSLVGSSVSQVEFDLEAEKLSCLEDLGTVQLIGHQSDQELKATIIGNQISGSIIQPLNSWQTLVQIKLDKLILDPKNSLNNAIMQDVQLSKAYQVGIKELVLSSKTIKDVELMGEPISNGFEIKRFQANSYQTQFNATGTWHYAPRQTQILGTVSSPNISQFVQAWSIPGSMKSGQAEIPFDLTWEGNPWQFEFANLSGKLDVNMKAGQIVGVEPGIGRVLSLFNLDTIKRRLKLDFSDLFKEGLAFDSLKANTVLQQGKVKTSNLQLKAPSSTIGGDLVLDWPTDQVSGTLYVSPNISGSIPMAAAIAAGSPAVGAAFWALEKLMSKSNVVKETPTGRYIYQISGTLSNPLLTEKGSKVTQ